MGAAVSAALQVTALIAQGTATAMKIEEAKSDYQAQIDMLNEQKNARLAEIGTSDAVVTSGTGTGSVFGGGGGHIAAGSYVDENGVYQPAGGPDTGTTTTYSGAAGRAKEMGIAGINEKAASAKFDTQLATMKAELTASSSEAKLGASGVRAGGSALMAAQQQTDIAYAAADRTAEAGAAGVRIGGLQLANTLKDYTNQRSLLTLEYGQKIKEAQRKKDYLNANEGLMIGLGAAGGLAGLPSSFYQTVFGA